MMIFTIVNGALCQPESIRNTESIVRYRGLYVNKLDQILAQPNEDRELLSWALTNHINTLSLYNLHSVLATEKSRNDLSAFIKLARQYYKIDKIIAVIPNTAFYNNQLSIYSEGTDSLSQFDGFNIEWEWWVGVDKFAPYAIDLAKTKGMLPLETYVGWFSKGKKKALNQAKTLVRYSEIISVHAYHKKVHGSYVWDRLKLISDAAQLENKVQSVVIIFSMEPQFMGPLSRKYTYDEMYEELMSQIREISIHEPDALAHIRIIGWKIFDQEEGRKFRPH